jgi:hypothetical protein
MNAGWTADPCELASSSGGPAFGLLEDLDGICTPGADLWLAGSSPFERDVEHLGASAFALSVDPHFVAVDGGPAVMGNMIGRSEDRNEFRARSHPLKPSLPDGGCDGVPPLTLVEARTLT